MGNTLKARDKQHIWHPYTQMKENPEAIGIVRGSGVWLFDEEGNRYLDSISSWWVNLHGHAHPYIAEKIAEQARELEHCIFAGFTHEPAVRLAENLLKILPANIKKIFYSDNGSTAVEVALKMALQYWQNMQQPQKKRILALEHAYHGDTFAAMSVSARGLFNRAFNEYLFEVTFVPFPDKVSALASVTFLESELQKGDVAAFIFEPLVLGASGMLMYEASVLEKYIILCNKYKTIAIADEVFTGFGRTGKLFASDYIKHKPDIICLSKGITGGTMAMGVTACSEKVYETFLSTDPAHTFYHGHSFTANPLTCAAANASFDLLNQDSCLQSIERISKQQAEFCKRISTHVLVEDSRCCGTIAALTLKTTAGTSYTNELRTQLYQKFLSRAVLIRPLGNIIYAVPPYCISDEELAFLHQQFLEVLDELTYQIR